MKKLFVVLSITIANAVYAYYPSPTDWRNENIYQIFTDRYYDGDPSNDNAEAGHGSPYAPSDPHGIHGGDFKGIQQKLDYIKSLGATAIWISPIPLNVGGTSAYHGYGAQDFYTLAPHWGTMTDLSNMVSAAHARGIKVILDIVCNHSGDLIDSGDPGYPNFKYPPGGYNMRYKNIANQHAPPFNITNAVPPAFTSIFHTNGVIQSYTNSLEYTLGELSSLDDFATETTYVRTNMMNIYSNWVAVADFDGFRIDTVKHVDYGFWQYWCPQLHQFGASIGKSNFFMFGEVFNASLGDDPFVGSYTGTKAGGPYMLDSTLDYVLYGQINSIFASASGSTQPIETHYNQIAADYDTNAWYRLVTFLDNHDNPRFLSISGATTNRLAVALEFLYTSRGVPSLYYGTEQAFNGTTDPNDREDMFAGQFEQGPSLGDNFNETHPLFQLVAKLNNFRRLYPALCTGAHSNRWNNPSGPGLFAYSRVLSNEEVFVVLNTATSTQTLTNRTTLYPPSTILVNLLNTNETIVVSPTTNTTPVINVPSTTAKIFIAQSLLQPLDPVVVGQSPAHAATNVATIARVVLQFSKPMDTNSVQAAFSLTPATSGTFSWSAVHDTMTFTPSGSGYPAHTTNLIHIATNAMDSVSGNTFYAAYDEYFVSGVTTSIDVQPPSISISQPANDATVSGSVIVSGTASDNVAVQKVEVSLDGGTWTLASGTTSWSYSLNTVNTLNGTHTISARATDTSSNVSSTASVTARVINVPGSYLQRISTGDPFNATDCVNNVWVKDQAYSLGSFGYSSSSSTGFVNAAITGVCSNFWRLYQWERYSSGASFSYLFDCPEGIYEIKLLEAETYWTNNNQREFNLFIQGQQVLTNYDIFAHAGGQNIPVTLVFTAAVTDAQLEMDFAPGAADNARASGIQVTKIGDVDSDGDGIPDWWMLAYFNHPTGQSNDNSLAYQDADGDGMSNLQEFLAGTDPTDPTSVFQITNIGISGNDVTVTWTTQANKTNQLQSSSDPGTNSTWNSVGSITLGTGSPVSQTDFGAATNPPNFYRVRLIQ